MKTYQYRALGLTIASEIECLELLEGAGKPDVKIRIGKIPKKYIENEDWDHFWRATPDYFFFTIKDVGMYLVTSGNTILVECYAGVNDPDLRVFLLGTCLGVILHQRGILPIHGSGVVVNDGSVIFSGEIGAGKSTLAGAFVNRGAKIVADDVCAISFIDQGQPIIHPGYAQMKLCVDAASHFNMMLNDYNRVSSYSDKLCLPVANSIQKKPLPVSVIYFLDKCDQVGITIRELTGREKFFHVSENIYRKSLISDLSRGRAHFKNTSRLVERVKMFQVLRPEAAPLSDDLVDCIEKHLQL